MYFPGSSVPLVSCPISISSRLLRAWMRSSVSLVIPAYLPSWAKNCLRKPVKIAEDMAFNTWPCGKKPFQYSSLRMVCAAISICRRAALVDQRIDPHGGAAAEQRFELPFVVVDRVQGVDARHADRARRCRIVVAESVMRREALGQRRNREERIHSQRARNHRPIGHVQSRVDAAVAREHAAERVHRALQVIVAHRAAAQRMRRDQVPQVEHAPGRVGNEVAAQRVRVAAHLFVHAREDLLLPGLVPGDAYACRRVRSRALRTESYPRALSCPITRYSME